MHDNYRAGYAIVLVSLFAMSAVGLPATSAVRAPSHGALTPCVSIHPNDPSVGLEPGCILGGYGSSSSSSGQSEGIDAQAVMNGTGVELSWELGKEHPAIDRFRILRGETNDTLTAIDTTDAEARGYIDEGALFSGEARWYKVQALNHGGHVVTESPPTHISLVPPGG